MCNNEPYYKNEKISTLQPVDLKTLDEDSQLHQRELKEHDTTKNKTDTANDTNKNKTQDVSSVNPTGMPVNVVLPQRTEVVMKGSHVIDGSRGVATSTKESVEVINKFPVILLKI